MWVPGVSRGLHCGQPALRILFDGWQIPGTQPWPPFQAPVTLRQDETVEGGIEGWVTGTLKQPLPTASR